MTTDMPLHEPAAVNFYLWRSCHTAAPHRQLRLCAPTQASASYTHAPFDTLYHCVAPLACTLCVFTHSPSPFVSVCLCAQCVPCMCPVCLHTHTPVPPTETACLHGMCAHTHSMLPVRTTCVRGTTQRRNKPALAKSGRDPSCCTDLGFFGVSLPVCVCVRVSVSMHMQLAAHGSEGRLGGAGLVPASRSVESLGRWAVGGLDARSCAGPRPLQCCRDPKP